MTRKQSPLRGFTLIEIMIVVLIIGVLLSIALPNFAQAREKSRRNSCISNLVQIQGAKEQWVIDTRKNSSQIPTSAELFGPDQYIRSAPSCPSGGTYTIRRVSLHPICTFENDPVYPHSIASVQP
ncbi:MAG: prepilin-type N-terminal cleavage/methylation domain-containing protein [Capsulimonadales bacterium]|nr:prepilin-type N-terminal cleavage/methylation domain-containing protein [Capsulimonadales bacterium]